MVNNMKDNKPYIVVAQTHGGVLKSIKRDRKKDSANNVIFTSNPGDVLNEALVNPVDLVVTGQCFYQTDISTLGEAIKVAQGGINEIAKHYQPPISGPSSGSDLSEELYKINPEILVFRYSLTPSARGKIVGDIEKWGTNSKLIELIDSEELVKILQEKDWDRMESTFQNIEFYKGWKEEHR
jgi:hypothetical protein